MKFLLFLIAIASAQQQCLDSADTYINKRCFKLVNQPMSWQDARNWCHYRNPVTSSYLATVIDKTTANFLASIARTAFNINDGLFWIGLSRYNSSSRWQWDDGTPFVWSNFDANNNQNLNYAAESITNGKWVTKYGDEKYNFVCSYDPNAQPGTTGTPGTASWGTTVPIEQTTENDWTTTSDGPTPTASECTRRTNSTILFAYSTDSLQYDLDSVRSSIVFDSRSFHGYTTFANIRIDVKQAEEIQYHSDIYMFNGSVTAHPANSSIGYGDTTTGSDVFKAIQKFLNNDQATICGSIIYVLVKRYPNEADVTDLINQLRENHVFVYFIVHTSPSGGTLTKPLFEMSSRTNGFCIFMGSRNYWVVGDNGLAVIYRPYQFLAENYVVSGSGSIDLPIFKTPSPRSWSQQTLVVVTVQDKFDGNLVSLNYQISTVDGTLVYPTVSNPWRDRFGTGIIAHPQLNGTVDYKMTIDYNYRTTEQQVIEVRMHSNYYHDFVPFASN